MSPTRHRRRSLLLAVIVGASAGPAPGFTGVEEGVPPGTYTYEEALSLGIYTGPSPEDVGLPVCPLDPAWKGLGPDEDIPETARDEAPTCLADRRSVTYMIGASPPHAGYHFNGYRTVDDLAAGAEVSIEIRNAEVNHLDPTPTDEEFVVSRVLTQNSANEDWLEVGYGEHSWEAATYPRVYTYVTRGASSSIWAWYGQYGLS